jgi:hypothetical protein
MNAIEQSPTMDHYPVNSFYRRQLFSILQNLKAFASVDFDMELGGQFLFSFHMSDYLLLGLSSGVISYVQSE